MWSACFVFLCLLAGSYQLKINEFEVPESAEVGSDVLLKCGFELDASDGTDTPYVKWWFISLYVPDKRVHLYQRVKPGEVPYVHQGIELVGNDDIIVKNVTHLDTGYYECEVSGYHERRVNKTLIVYSKGTGPQLNITEVKDGDDADEDEDLLLECHADGVTPQPELVISANGRPVDGVQQFGSSPSEEFLYSVTANVTVTKKDFVDVVVKCELSYVDHNLPHPLFVDEETYSSGLPATTESAESTAAPADLRQSQNETESQPNRSTIVSFSWCLSIAALLISLQISSLL